MPAYWEIKKSESGTKAITRLAGDNWQSEPSGPAPVHIHYETGDLVQNTKNRLYVLFLLKWRAKHP